MPDSWRKGIGQRGREWVAGHFNAPAVTEMTLKLYSDIAQSRKSS
jgi:glycosyltransferase involved in cell wall biosynthesis